MFIFEVKYLLYADMGYPKKHRGRRKVGSRKRRAKRRAKKK
jgi:hypothetical protein